MTASPNRIEPSDSTADRDMPALPPTLFRLPDLDPVPAAAKTPLAPATPPQEDVPAIAETLDRAPEPTADVATESASAPPDVLAPSVVDLTSADPFKEADGIDGPKDLAPNPDTIAQSDDRPIAANPDAPAGRSWTERMGSQALVLVILLIVAGAALMAGREPDTRSVPGERELQGLADGFKVDDGDQAGIDQLASNRNTGANDRGFSSPNTSVMVKRVNADLAQESPDSTPSVELAATNSLSAKLPTSGEYRNQYGASVPADEVPDSSFQDEVADLLADSVGESNAMYTPTAKSAILPGSVDEAISATPASNIASEDLAGDAQKAEDFGGMVNPPSATTESALPSMTQVAKPNVSEIGLGGVGQAPLRSRTPNRVVDWSDYLPGSESYLNVQPQAAPGTPLPTSDSQTGNLISPDPTYRQPGIYGQSDAYGQPNVYGQPGLYGQPTAGGQPTTSGLTAPRETVARQPSAPSNLRR
ncbi:MAG: hypothetical protein AAGA03_01760 [Planctomycetota bacterium]